MLNVRHFLLLAAFCVAAGLAACSTAPKSPNDRDLLKRSADITIRKFKENDPSLERVFDKAYAWAVFPTVTKGGAGIGGAHGRGVVYVGGDQVAWTDVSQATVGLQLGGQAYRELIFFRHQDAFETFRDGKFALAAQASAVAADKGAAANADWEDGVLIFTMTRGGLMYEASVGGQKFDYEPMN